MPSVASSRRLVAPRGGLSVRVWCALLAVAAGLQIALVAVYYWPEPKALVGDEPIYLESARAIAEGESDPEPMRAPLYARLLALLGVSAAHRWPIQALQLGVLLLTAALLRWLTRRLTGSALAADLAAALVLLYPTLGAYALYLWPEILHIGLWVGSFTILASGRRHPAWLGAAGLLVALALLARHLLLGFLPLLLGAVWVAERRRGQSPAAAVRSLLWLAAPIALLVTPVLAADRLDDGRLRASSNAQFNLWVGLNDPSPWRQPEPIVYPEYLDYLASADTPTERDRRLAEKTNRLLAERGWLAIVGEQLGKQYFRLFDHRSFFGQQLPGGALHGGRRGYRGPGPLATALLRWLDHSVYGLLLVAFAWGLWRAPYRRSIWLVVALAFLAYNLVLFLGLHAKSRYLLQLVPFMIPFAALGLAGWIDGPRLEPGRRLAATLLSAFLLWLAFGPSWLGSAAPTPAAGAAAQTPSSPPVPSGSLLAGSSEAPAELSPGPLAFALKTGVKRSLTPSIEIDSM